MPTVFVTGANRGLGLEFVRQYADDGWDVIACCRKPDDAKDLQSMAGKNKKIRVEKLEVTDAKDIVALAAKLKDTAIDILINNAGVPRTGEASKPDVKNYYSPEQEFEQLDPEKWMGALKVNTIAPILISRAFTPNVAKSKEKKIVMLSSRYGSIELDRPDLIAYSTTKAALNMAMRKMAQLLQPQNIAVASLHPGWAQTDMGGKNAEVPVDKSVSGMRKIISGLSLKQSGSFFGYDGEVIPW